MHGAIAQRHASPDPKGGGYDGRLGFFDLAVDDAPEELVAVLEMLGVRRT